ncbi:MAG: 4Fe-4S binding protein [Candidatus Eremiobacteraeota bacterium]|nr:4Fe-4S binding protein [Candidatus Eremiobacteraeota bacterium]
MPFMLPTILQNLLGGYATRVYPDVARDLPARVRGHVQFDEKTCIFCANCARRCPAEAISVNTKGKELTFYPDRCIVCEVCVEVCPRQCIELRSQWRKPFTERPVEVYRSPSAPREPQAEEPAPPQEKTGEEKPEA